ncbi:sialate O-acetylesterase [Chitinophaga sp. CB10]|uniref:sialate O-acetylesterase n=1 Tax=Chitinophaga sp. CB10 TaxID=1891659 RepID=UPI0025BDD61C|nr:sialate O-acetylesterase [Chitinophaga sp. CB10]
MHFISRFKQLMLLLALPLLIHSQRVAATVKLPYFFGNNMVLQQQTNAAIWGWAKPGSTVTVTTSWNKKKYSQPADASGKWKLQVATPAAGGPYEITISDGSPLTLKNVLIGEVWLCSGQSNMEMPMKGFKDQPIIGSNDAIFNSANDQLRLFTLPRAVTGTPQDTCKPSEWKAAEPESVTNFSATAYYFGRLLQQRLKVPVGLVCISYGGSPAEAFMSTSALKEFPDIKLPEADTKLTNKVATTLYNGMIHPFIGFTIKGCIWYQGETNADRPAQYETLFPAMVKSWRTEFGQGDFPFYFAQIAPYTYVQHPDPKRDEFRNSAYLRDAQRKAAHTIPNSGMVVLMDLGEAKCIHPADKETGGKRFAYLALSKTYQQKGFAAVSPDYDSLVVNGNTATIKFKDAPNGLTSFGKTLEQFEIAGSDRKFYPATAVIKQGAVQLSAPEVSAPVAVRYAFKDFVVGDLFSTEGFPVSSFRTDSW